MARPNVLLVILDAARRDAFEPYGAQPGSTPALAQLAARGVAHPEVFATACWTLPSHASIFTGLLPRAAGLPRAPDGKRHKCRPIMERHATRLLPAVLRAAGYETLAVSANPWLSEQSGFSIGFDRLTAVETRRQAQLTGTTLRARLGWMLEAVRAFVDDGADQVAKILEHWFAAGPREPFFCFVNVVECHSPYLPPRPYADPSPIERVRAAQEARRYLHLEAIWRACLGGVDIPPDAIDRMRRFYGASIRYLDDWLARVLEALDRQRLLDDTVVIVTADHGENLGESGLVTHALSLDNRLIHVPFVTAGPAAPEAGEIHSLAALPRTIARIAGLADHPWDDEDLPSSEIGVAQFDPPLSSASDPRTESVMERWRLGEEAAARFTTPLMCATDGRFKVLLRGDKEEIYDMASDPLEQNPSSPNGDGPLEGPAISRLRAALAHPSATTSPESLELGSPTSEPAPDAEELRKLEERMRLLGYM